MSKTHKSQHSQADLGGAKDVETERMRNSTDDQHRPRIFGRSGDVGKLSKEINATQYAATANATAKRGTSGNNIMAKSMSAASLALGGS